MIRNTYTGIPGVDPGVREAARGMGMTDRQVLFQVELPLAMGVILAGVRVATVITVGVATIAAAIGAGGLGEFIFRGVAMVDNRLILAGALPAAVMALLANFLLMRIERRAPVDLMKQPLAAFTFAGCLLLSACGAGQRRQRIVVGSKNFTEQAILGEILAQQMEAKTQLKVERRFYLAGTYICHQAMLAGRIDLYVEYTGTALTAVLKQPVESDASKVYDQVKREYARASDSMSRSRSASTTPSPW